MKSLLALQISNALKQNKWVPENVESIEYKHAHQPESIKPLIDFHSNIFIVIDFGLIRPMEKENLPDY
jgi:hypothetical protein